jgi:DNA-binding response OmpR family regulator
MRVGALELDPMSRDAWVDGAPVHLTSKEFALALLLATEPTRVFTRTELLADVWGFCRRRPDLTPDASRLRRKLASALGGRSTSGGSLPPLDPGAPGEHRRTRAGCGGGSPPRW